MLSIKIFLSLYVFPFCFSLFYPLACTFTTQKKACKCCINEQPMVPILCFYLDMLFSYIPLL
uniref:Transmembrane protein n=1 Tax=Medicago truncatula TaxID=3880 RepID=I3SG63_MEDTR|nr:unknown [Medicago truncatula]